MRLDVIMTEIMVYVMNCLPSFSTPIINKGKFNIRFKIPVLIGVTIPNIMAIPLTPPLKIWWGIIKKLNPTDITTEPKTIITILRIFIPSLR